MNKFIKGVLIVVVGLLVLILWDSGSSIPSSSFCDSIEMTDSYKEIKRKSKIKNFKVSELNQNNEVWVYTQPDKSGMYQEGVACVITMQKDKIIEKNIRAY